MNFTSHEIGRFSIEQGDVLVGHTGLRIHWPSWGVCYLGRGAISDDLFPNDTAAPALLRPRACPPLAPLGCL